MGGKELPFRKQLEDVLEERIESVHPVSGGHICHAYRLKSKNDSFFVKCLPNAPAGLFRQEARGLEEIRHTHTVTVPGVLAATEDFLLLEYIPPGRPKENFYENFADKLAHMHGSTKDFFGFEEDNFLGSTVQPNKAREDWTWAQFFWHQRLLFQCHLALENRRVDESFYKNFLQLKPRVLELLEHPGPFSLLHGDLWSGNIHINTAGEACLIDPAVYYGHREAELAMMELFGGLEPNFFSAYHREFPLESGHRERLPLYQLYHIMNHLNLFGGGYREEAEQIIKAYR